MHVRSTKGLVFSLGRLVASAAAFVSLVFICLFVCLFGKDEREREREKTSVWCSFFFFFVVLPSVSTAIVMPQDESWLQACFHSCWCVSGKRPPPFLTISDSRKTRAVLFASKSDRGLVCSGIAAHDGLLCIPSFTHSLSLLLSSLLLLLLVFF